MLETDRGFSPSMLKSAKWFSALPLSLGFALLEGTFVSVLGRGDEDDMGWPCFVDIDVHLCTPGEWGIRCGFVLVVVAVLSPFL